MSYLLDTNILSELYKGPKCDIAVAAWAHSAGDDNLFISVLVLGEIRKGIEKLRGRDRARAAELEEWLGSLPTQFADRILGVDQAVADVWGHLGVRRSLAFVDSLIAATALTHGLTLVTRNEADVRGLSVAVLNPFRFAPT